MNTKVLIFLIITVLFLMSGKKNYANNIRLENLVKVTEVNGNIATLEILLKWDNAWRDSYNWDAVWLFLKYKTAGSNWQSLNLEASGHTLIASDSKTYTFLPGKTNDKTVGLFILLNEATTCNPSLTCRIKWKLPAGITKETFENNNAFILAQGIEMVYIPFGAYQLGDEAITEAFSPVIIDNEEPRAINTCANPSQTIPLAAEFPKGYQGFHIMKYETSQEQYVTFLNTLTLAQQQELIPNHTTLKPGDYIVGNPERPNYRNGIILAQKPKGKPMIFDNNLTPGEEYGQENDGKYLPCNYMNIQTMAAYCAWAGLRPPTELEFEKTCRRPLPDLPIAQEYIWGTTDAPLYAQVINSENTPGEKPGSGQINAGGFLNGPLRCGSFAAVSPGQQSSGATYWGVMELAGNLREIYATVKNTGVSSTAHGTGEYTTHLWGTNPQSFGYKGGSFASPKEALRTADRSEIEQITDSSTPDSTAGFRGVRTFVAGEGITIQPGSIALAGGGTTVCPGEEIVINSITPATVTGMDNLPISYIWYLDGKALTEVAEYLKIDSLHNTGTSPETHTIKRKAVCMLGEATTEEITISVFPNPEFTLSSTTVNIDIEGNSTTVTATASVTGVTLNFNWTYQGTTIATGPTYTPATSHFGNTPGIYTVNCEASSGDCSSTPIKKEITVKYVTQTAGTIELADGITDICPEGKSITIDNTASAIVSSGETIVYSWKVNGIVQSGLNQETLTYTIPQNPGNSAENYSFIRVATTSEGSKETAPLTVSAKPWPNFTIDPVSAEFAITENGPQITATSSSGITLSYVWKYNGNTVSSTNTYTPIPGTFGNKTGNYTVVCTSSLNGCTATTHQDLAIRLNNCGGNFTDPRDNKVYPTVKIGTQCWMAKNLNYGKMETASSDYWKFDEAGVQKWCYDNSESNCTTYGALYEWWEVVCNGKCNGSLTTSNADISISNESKLASFGAKMVSGNNNQVQGICPDGWHLPNNAEWTLLGTYRNGWNKTLGGYRFGSGGSFSAIDQSGYWWSSTTNAGYTFYWGLYYYNGIGTNYTIQNYSRSYGFSVRCIQN